MEAEDQDVQLQFEVIDYFTNKFGSRLVSRAISILNQHAVERQCSGWADAYDKLEAMQGRSRSYQIAFDMFLHFVVRKREREKKGFDGQPTRRV